MTKKTIHTCYGCSYYYRVNEIGKKEYLKPHSYRHCDFDNVWDCDYFSNDGEVNKKVSKGE